MIADDALPFRVRMRLRVSVRILRISRAFLRGSLDLNKSDLNEGPSFSERMQAKAREEMRAAERSRHLSQADIRDTGVAQRRPALMATISSLIGWAIIGSVIAVDYLIFRLLFDVNYFSWYLENGAVINIVFSVISLAVVLDAYTGLISSNPFRYLWACMALTDHVSLAAFAFNPDEDAPGDTAPARRARETDTVAAPPTTPCGSTPRPRARRSPPARTRRELKQSKQTRIGQRTGPGGYRCCSTPLSPSSSPSQCSQRLSAGC